MKVLLIIAALLIVHTQANFFDKIRQHFASLGTTLLKNLDKTGANLVNTASSKGVNLLSQSLQYFLIQLANNVNKGKNGGTRDLSDSADFKEEVVATFRSLALEMRKGFQYMVHRLHGVLNKMSKLESKPAQLIKEIEQIVGSHNLVADTFLHATAKLETFLSNGMSHKRSGAKEFMSTLQTRLHTLLAPVIEELKSLAVTTGDSLKGMIGEFKSTLMHLKDSLKPRIDEIHNLGVDLLHTGASALHAAKDAATDIVHE